MTATPIRSPLPVRTLGCARCGTTFQCGTGGKDGGCWCMDESARLPMPAAPTAACLCPACLGAALADLDGTAA